jgi:chromate reductase
MGATLGGGGTARAQTHLRDGFAFTGGIVLPLLEVLVPLADAKSDADGDLIDEETAENVHDLLRALAAWTRRVRTRPEDEAAAS